MELLIGADPELFVMKGGEFVSAYGMIEGDKENPQKVKDGAVQVDGMALEFNIDPAKDEDSFIHNIYSVMGTLVKMVDGYDVVTDPVAHFPEGYIAMQPLKARELGCEPDYNAYTGGMNKTPDGEVDFRTAAGHIHIGWTEGIDPLDPGHFEACCMLAKALDRSLGIPSVVWDRDTTRRKLYGNAGAFRPKSYGCEYRVLSNAWLKHPKLARFVYSRAIRTFNDLVEGGKPRYEDFAENTIVELLDGRFNPSVEVLRSYLIREGDGEVL